MISFYSRVLLSCSVFMLAACGSKPASDLYVLRAPESAQTYQCKAAGGLVIDRPYARDEFDTKRIAVMLSNSHLTYYTGAAWASPFPDQLRDFLIDDFSHYEGLAVAEGETEDSKQLHSLTLTIHDASVSNAGSPVVRLRMTAVLRDAHSNRAVSKLRIQESVPAEANHMPEIVEAFNKASENASQKIAKALKLKCQN